MKNNFKLFLESKNLTQNTISAYLFTVKQFKSKYNSISKKSINSYKVWLIDNYKPKTVNLRLQGINCYLEFIGKSDLKTQFIKIQQKTFLENVISEADYEYFKSSLKKDNELFWYFVVRFLGATGARISELLQIKIEHITQGYLDLYSKQISFKFKFFLNKYGKRMTTRGISGQLKKFAEKYGIDKKIIYPHSFRHRFAKNFLEKYNDIALLADLMGHESIETTRIYLRKTTTEQKEIVDTIIDW